MLKTTVRYAVKYEEFTVTDAEYDIIHHLYNKYEKVLSIKFLRSQYGLGLKEAKDICDAIGSAPRIRS